MSEPESRLLELLQCTNEASGDVYPTPTSQGDAAAARRDNGAAVARDGRPENSGLSRSSSTRRVRSARHERSRSPPRTPPPPPPAFEPHRASLYTELEGLMNEWDTVIADSYFTKSRAAAPGTPGEQGAQNVLGAAWTPRGGSDSQTGERDSFGSWNSRNA